MVAFSRKRFRGDAPFNAHDKGETGMKKLWMLLWAAALSMLLACGAFAEAQTLTLPTDLTISIRMLKNTALRWQRPMRG